MVPLGAKVMWLQPSVASATAKQLAAEYGFELVEDVDIAIAAQKVSAASSKR
jgi:predicted CoA-binding protein